MDEGMEQVSGRSPGSVHRKDSGVWLFCSKVFNISASVNDSFAKRSFKNYTQIL
jgi:hypothetical protein